MPLELQDNDQINILSTCKDAFITLGIQINEDQSIQWKLVKQALRKAQLKTHPDKPGGSPDKFRNIQNAFKKIKNTAELATPYDAYNEKDWIEEEIKKHAAAQAAAEDTKKRESSWLDIIYDTPDMSLPELLSLLRQFKLTLSSQFFLAVQLKRNDLLKSLLETTNIDRREIETISHGFQWAAGKGRLKKIKLFQAALPPEIFTALINSDAYNAFHWAAAEARLYPSLMELRT